MPLAKNSGQFATLIAHTGATEGAASLLAEAAADEFFLAMLANSAFVIDARRAALGGVTLSAANSCCFRLRLERSAAKGASAIVKNRVSCDLARVLPMPSAPLVGAVPLGGRESGLAE